MTKKELSELLHTVNIPVNEGVTELEKEKEYPRIDYWEITWEDILGSGDNYQEQTTYQVSLYSRTPACKELKDLRTELRTVGIHPAIYHEYIEKDRMWHSYLSITTMEESE